MQKKILFDKLGISWDKLGESGLGFVFLANFGERFRRTQWDCLQGEAASRQTCGERPRPFVNMVPEETQRFVKILSLNSNTGNVQGKCRYRSYSFLILFFKQNRS